MAGDYTDSIRPTLPGAYTRYVAQRPALVPPSPGVTVALPIVTDWGPMDVPTLVGSFAEYGDDFGVDGVPSDTTGSRAVKDCFTGEGLEGIGGAGGALVARIGGSAAAKATVALTNPTPTHAMDATALYEGARANAFKLVISPIVSNVQQVDVYDGTALKESYVYTVNVAGALAGLTAAVAAASKLVRLPLTLEGTTGLTAGTFSLAGGNDGATLTAGDHTASWDLFANESFAFFAPMDIPYASGGVEPAPTNRSILTSLVTWHGGEVAAGHRFELNLGLALDATVTDALAFQAAVAAAPSARPEAINLFGGPGVNDAVYGARSTSQLAPRTAGIYANRGETQIAHFARLAGTTPRPKAAGGSISTADAIQLTNGGVVAIMRDRYAAAPTRLVKAITAWTLDTTDKPKRIYSNPKFVLTMQQLANEIEADAERFLIGRVPMSPKTRDAAAARALRIVRAREPNAIGAGSKVTALPGEDTDEFVDLQIDLVFGRALAQLFIRANVT